MDDQNSMKRFVCIEYPGVVKNVDKAIETLGGINQISKVFESEKNRMELRFRPDDPFCKPAYGKKYPSYSYLLKLKVRTDENGDKTVVSTEVLGFVDTVYKFEKFMDYQYLPLVKKSDLPNDEFKLKSILNELVPLGMLGIDWFNKAQNTFLVPPLFSRIEMPSKYAFRSYSNLDDPSDLKQKIVSNLRKTRMTYVCSLTFNHIDPIPEKPKKKSIENLESKPIMKSAYERVVKAFQDKPVWSKIELMYKLDNISKDDLKITMPCVAYYYITGPWRKLWVRFGFDPRKEPSCRIYQTIDFRVKNTGGLKRLITSRNSNRNLFTTESKENEDISKSNSNIDMENWSIFRPGVLPPRRQTFYQFCNLEVPEIKDALSKLGEVLPGSLCHERRGWLPVDFEEMCRDILNKLVLERMRELSMENSSFGNISNNYIDDDEEENDEGDNMQDENLSEDEDEIDFGTSDLNYSLPGPSHAADNQ